MKAEPYGEARAPPEASFVFQDFRNLFQKGLRSDQGDANIPPVEAMSG